MPVLVAVGRSYISNRKRVSFANVDARRCQRQWHAYKGKEIWWDDVALLSVRVARLMLGCGGGGGDRGVNLSGSFSVGCLWLSAWVGVAMCFNPLRLLAREVEAIIGIIVTWSVHIIGTGSFVDVFIDQPSRQWGSETWW
jgi:hypothetical protein